MIKLCIFDLDGTLVNSLPAISHYANSALEKYGFAPHIEDKYRQFVGDGAAVLVHRMLGENDNAENFAKVKAEYDRLYESDVLYLTEPYSGIPTLLENLKKQKIALAVLSNKPHNVVCMIIEKLFGKDVFDVCFGQRDGIAKKPAPDGVFEICAASGVSAAETAFIGDTSVDIETGKNSGAKTIGVLWGFRERAELENADADYIVLRAEQIFDIAVKE